MIIVTRPNVTDAELEHIRERVESVGLKVHLSRGERRTIIGCIGDERLLAEVPLQSLPGVESVTPVLKPYKLASREFSADRSAIRVGDAHGASVAVFGGEAVAVIAGPCSVEGADMLHASAAAVRDAGAVALRGGAFKPRTSPYSFQGLGVEALRLLAAVRAETGLPVVTEVLDTRHVDTVAEYADMLQVGARNMQNFALLAELGRARRPVLLKRGLSATVEELLMAAEYVMANGNHDGRAVRARHPHVRAGDAQHARRVGHPGAPARDPPAVVVDPSHAGGTAELVRPLAFAAVAAGADGLIIEVHPGPGVRALRRRTSRWRPTGRADHGAARGLRRRGRTEARAPCRLRDGWPERASG
jgi:3-deoxy-7-phosphoheptulonate synthase